jgi:diguanylate cyclase (GGDEF)-like protein
MAETQRPEEADPTGSERAQQRVADEVTLEEARNGAVLERVAWSAVALAGLFVAFAIYNVLDPWLPLAAAGVMRLAGANMAVAAFFAGIFAVLRADLLLERYAHPLLGASAAVLLANTLYSMHLVGDLVYTHYLVVLLIGAGSVALSVRWQLALLAATYGAWAWVAHPIGGGQGLARFSFVLAASGLVSTVTVFYRAQNHRRFFDEISRRREVEERLNDVNRRLEDLSQRDPLTNLFNRRGIFDRLEIELARAGRGHTLGLLLVDLDGFKEVNDRYGHIEGDRLLQAIAEALLRGTRTSDAVGRYGGDEFIVILSDTRQDDVSATAQRLVERVQKVGVQLFPASPVTASGGLALASSGDTPLALIERADGGVYDAKRDGGNRVRPAA